MNGRPPKAERPSHYCACCNEWLCRANGPSVVVTLKRFGAKRKMVCCKACGDEISTGIIPPQSTIYGLSCGDVESGVHFEEGVP